MTAVEEAFLPLCPGPVRYGRPVGSDPGVHHPGHHALLRRGGMPPPSSSPPARTIHAGGSLPLRHRPAQPGGHRPAGGPAGGEHPHRPAHRGHRRPAAKHLAREDAATAGLVGCGVQGLHQLTFLCQVRPIRTVYLYNHGSKDLGPFCRQLEAMVAPSRLPSRSAPTRTPCWPKATSWSPPPPPRPPSSPMTPPPSGASASSPSAPGSRTCGRFPRPSGRPPGRSFWSSPSPARRAATCASPWPPAP